MPGSAAKFGRFVSLRNLQVGLYARRLWGTSKMSGLKPDLHQTNRLRAGILPVGRELARALGSASRHPANALLLRLRQLARRFIWRAHRRGADAAQRRAPARDRFDRLAPRARDLRFQLHLVAREDAAAQLKHHE